MQWSIKPDEDELDTLERQILDLLEGHNLANAVLVCGHVMTHVMRRIPTECHEDLLQAWTDTVRAMLHEKPH